MKNFNQGITNYGVFFLFMENRLKNLNIINSLSDNYNKGIIFDLFLNIKK